MNAKRVFLSNQSGEIVYPITTSDNIYCDDIILDDKIEDIEDKIENIKEAQISAEEVLSFEDLKIPTREEVKKDLFIDMWNRVCKYSNNGALLRDPIGGYDIETGLFSLNGIADITYHEALRIFLASMPNWSGQIDLRYAYAGESECRTFFPIKGLGAGYNYSRDMREMFAHCLKLEVISCSNNYGNFNNNSMFINLNYSNMFYQCDNLRKILTPVWISVSTCNAFQQTPLLEYMALHGNSVDGLTLDLSRCPNWSYESVSSTIKNNTLMRHWTITVHPDVYAKLTGDTTNEAAASLTPEELRLWLDLLIQARESNITFGTI